MSLTSSDLARLRITHINTATLGRSSHKVHVLKVRTTFCGLAIDTRRWSIVTPGHPEAVDCGNCVWLIKHQAATAMEWGVWEWDDWQEYLAHLRPQVDVHRRWLDEPDLD